ncbi:PP2C family protein-serine/threonine phosphatase [Sphaerimonospora sp. CA-214678]|uniref:PP2C family protein-serine/threonine phosphatase n=1 Tax=Sphaerimonospora sp. CA-214678 TaxID=3240029 RepID=UPI003D93C052
MLRASFMVGLVDGAQPSLPPADDPEQESSHQLQSVRARAAECAHTAAGLRDVILPGRVDSGDLPYASIAVRSVPARSVPAGVTTGLGGDWHEAVRLPDGRLFLAVGDVSGHGEPAIDKMTRLRRALRGLSMSGDSPGLLLARLNTLVLDGFADTTATVVCGHLDPATRRLSWAQAGHPAPILVRRGSARQLAAPAGVVLGATANPPYGMAELRLAPGDLLLMFTDGLVERRDRDIGEGVSLALHGAEEITGEKSTGGDRRGSGPETAPAPGRDTGSDAGPGTRFDAGFDARLDRFVAAMGGPDPEDDVCLLAVRVTG